MKQFIYLDVERVKSLVAQINNGLEESYQKLIEQGQMNENTESATVSGEIKGGFKIPGIVELGSNVLGTKEDIEKVTDNEVVQEIHNIQIHDSVFDALIGYLSNNKKFISDSEKIITGSFVRGKGALQIIDFEYLEGLFRENSFISYLKRTQEEEIRTTLKEEQESLTREQRRKNVSEIRKVIEQAIKENNKQYDEIEQIIKAIKYIIPYKRMALSNAGFLIPLDDQCFRDTPDIFGLKYGGEFHYVGYVTNIIVSGDEDSNIENIFGTLQSMINQVLFSVLPTNADKLFVLHPLSLYLES